MFTGLIEEIGTVRRIERGAKGARLTIAANTVLENTKIGDSIATNGVCLTVVALTDDSFSADVMAESLRRSALGSLQSGSPVNLERAMPADGRFGGHIVSGHIDGTGSVLSQRREDNAVWVTIKTPAPLLRYIVEKGSIAIDGVSLHRLPDLLCDLQWFAIYLAAGHIQPAFVHSKRLHQIGVTVIDLMCQL